MKFGSVVVGAAMLGSLAWGAAAQEAAAPAQDRVEMLKASFKASKEALKKYEWVETVAVSLKGEEKSRKEFRCYYGAEGKLQKVPIAADDTEKKKRGLRGKAVENKKEEIHATMKAATTLLRQYVPLDPAKIEAAKAAGSLSTSTPSAEGLVRVTMKNYLKPGDEVVVDVDGTKNTLQGLAITSFVEDGQAKSPVFAKVTYAALPDGTLYPSRQSLELSAQSLKIDTETAGYKPLSQ
jgi:hypothetical protein